MIVFDQKLLYLYKLKLINMEFKKEKIEYSNYTPSRIVDQVVLRTTEEIDEYVKHGWYSLAGNAAKKYVNESPITVNSMGGWCTLGGDIRLVED